jgi:hypothetical protein
MNVSRPSLIALVLAFAASSLVADEAAYFDVRVADLDVVEGKLEAAAQPTTAARNDFMSEAARPYVVVEGNAEVYWNHPGSGDFRWVDNVNDFGTLHVRVPGAARDVVGRFFYPRRDAPGYNVTKFHIPASKAKADAQTTFLQAKLRHYERLRDDDVPGAAWFRHQIRATRLELPATATTTNADGTGTTFRTNTEFDDTFSFVSGNRAVSENLQLDRILPAARADETPVKLDSIEGITIQEIDWKKEIAGKQPTLDPLAAYIPADQHVAFFPTFEAAMTLADEADRQGTTFLQAAEPQSQDVGVVDRYQRQLGLRRTALGRMLGPQLIESLAVTGGDPYFRVGTDVALVFDAADVAQLRTALVAQIALNVAAEKDVKHETTELQGVTVESWRTPSRAVSSYLASYGDVVVVTNSPVQLRRLLDTHQAKSPSIASLDEFKFFRDRYPRGTGGETAFLFLSDATIRRWCGPHWRIADSRRTRDLAVLAELQAQNLSHLAGGTVEPGLIRTDLRLSTSGEVRLTADGVSSDAAGSLTFLTPISELTLDTVTKSEAEAYTRWRDGYQRNFSWAFDPIGLRLSLDAERIAGDLTIMPLIDNSSYREFVEISRGVKLKATSGDPHGALLHVTLAINKESARIKEMFNFASQFAPQLRIDPLSWLGDSVSLYVDDTPFWDELVKIIDESGGKLSQSQMNEQILARTGFQVPVALRFEVANPLKATAFVAGVRAFLEQTAPGMTVWETIAHGDGAYVKITPVRQAVAGSPFERAALFYALTPDAWTLSLSEEVIKRSLDRRVAAAKPAEAQAAAVPAAPLGESVDFSVKLRDGKILAAVTRDDYERQLRRLAWGNLPILNEWHRLYPNADPVALHERWWGVKPVCPGGGKYVWNETWQTMESSVFGSPAVPKSGPALPPQLRDFSGGRYGLTFEPQGLRARGELLRKK